MLLGLCFLIICEFLLFLHNTNIFVKIYVYFTMVINLFSLYISLYPIIYLKALCENCSFFHYFTKKPCSKLFLKIFLCEFLAYLCGFLHFSKK
nr:MAG TPA: hypothetical protein [Caudoviricetes sp.]